MQIDQIAGRACVSKPDHPFDGVSTLYKATIQPFPVHADSRGGGVGIKYWKDLTALQEIHAFSPNLRRHPTGLQSRHLVQWPWNVVAVLVQEHQPARPN